MSSGVGVGGGGGVAGAHLKEALTPVFAKLKSKNWQERGAAIAELEEVMTSAPTGAFGEELAVAVCDALVPRLADGNAKVSVQAFTMLAGVLPVLGDDVTPALGSLVPALAAGVGGANEKTRAAATAASDALIESCSATSLVQHVSHSVCFGVSRAKPDLSKNSTTSSNSSSIPGNPLRLNESRHPRSYRNDTNGFRNVSICTRSSAVREKTAARTSSATSEALRDRFGSTRSTNVRNRSP